MLKADVAVVGGTIVTVDKERRIIPGGLILITGDEIVYVGEADGVAWEARDSIDACGDIVMPGLIDVHGHAGHGLVKTMGDRPDGDWLEVAEAVYFRHSTDAFWRAEAALAGLERLKFGVTTGYSMLGNIPRTDDPRWAVSHIEGIRGIGIREIVGVGPGLPPWPKMTQIYWDGVARQHEFTEENAIEVTREICEMASRGDFGSRVTVQVSPSRIGDPEGLGEASLAAQTRAVMQIASEFDLMINAHAYSGNIAYAHRHLEVLGPRTVLAHCTGITPDEVQILAETGTHVAHCPSARAMIRDGCPVIEMLDAGVNVAIGTDGSGPDRTFCLFKDMRTAAIIHRIRGRDDRILPPGKLLEMVTIDAARAIGMEKQIGSLETGKKADVIIINTRQPHQYPLAMPVHRLVYVTSGQDVGTVIVDGEILMRNRQVIPADEDEVLANAQNEFLAMLDRSGFEDELQIPEGFWGQPRY